jgi:DNA-binding NarL/FixJ family response regulator
MRSTYRSEVLLFTCRERQILDALARGFPSKMIAQELRVCEASLMVGLRTLYRTIGVADRDGATAWALENGFG